mmetsp:Transcript_37595/g.87902  ORF Transcript_37595/g.87902 Transcript_37595/m.87902 type:complete len:277 (+) Transcript_37595:1318-2148(+)
MESLSTKCCTTPNCCTYGAMPSCAAKFPTARMHCSMRATGAAGIGDPGWPLAMTAAKTSGAPSSTSCLVALGLVARCLRAAAAALRAMAGASVLSTRQTSALITSTVGFSSAAAVAGVKSALQDAKSFRELSERVQISALSDSFSPPTKSSSSREREMSGGWSRLTISSSTLAMSCVGACGEVHAESAEAARSAPCSFSGDGVFRIRRRTLLIFPFSFLSALMSLPSLKPSFGLGSPSICTFPAASCASILREAMCLGYHSSSACTLATHAITPPV